MEQKCDWSSCMLKDVSFTASYQQESFMSTFGIYDLEGPSVD